MSCTLHTPVFNDPAPVFVRAREAIIADGGFVHGDWHAGEFSIPLTLGRITGTYALLPRGNWIIQVTGKPFWISCARIRRTIDTLFREGE